MVLKSELGSGGWGTVWLTHDTKLGRDVAVKIYRPQTITMISEVEQASALAKVSHPNVVKVYDFCAVMHPETSEVHDAVVMELIDGQTMFDFLGERVELDWEVALRLGRGVSEGALAIHKAGNVHCDLHEANVMVNQDGEAIIIDILARYSLASLSTMTREQLVLKDVLAVRDLLGGLLSRCSVVRSSGRARFQSIENCGIAGLLECFEEVLRGEGGSVSLGATPVVKRIDILKSHLAEEKYRIALSDHLADDLAAYELVTRGDGFDHSDPPNKASVEKRIRRYDSVSLDLVAGAMLVGRWGSEHARSSLVSVFRNLALSLDRQQYETWDKLQWYAVARMIYAVGLAGLESGDLSLLHRVLEIRCRVPGGELPVVDVVSIHMSELQRESAFDNLLDVGTAFSLSEHLAVSLEVVDKEAIRIGARFRHRFNQFECLYSLIVAFHRVEKGGRMWGPIGLFASRTFPWSGESKIDSLIAEFYQAPSPVLRAGFFHGSISEFTAFVGKYKMWLASVRF